MKKLVLILSVILFVSCKNDKFERYSKNNIPERAIGVELMNDLAPMWFDHQSKGMCWIPAGDDVMKESKKVFLQMIKDSTSINTGIIVDKEDYVYGYTPLMTMRWDHQDYVNFYSSMDKTDPNEVAKYLFYKFIHLDNYKRINKDVDSDIITYTCVAYSVDPDNQFDFSGGKYYLKTTKGPKSKYFFQYHVYKDGNIVKGKVDSYIE